MVKLKKLENSYINVSGKLYDSEFINLVQIRNDEINFDERTLFLNQSMKDQLNTEPIEKNNSGVYIIDNNGVKGIICNLPISEYTNGHVKNHELVLPETIQGMLSNYHGYNAEAAPVMLITQQEIDFDSFIEKNIASKEYTVKDIHVYFYEGQEADELLAIFVQSSTLYVGDGHHRLYSTSLSGFKQNVLSYVVCLSDVTICPIHRQLPHVTDRQFESALDFLTDKFKVDHLGSYENMLKQPPVKDTVLMFRNQDVWRIHLIKLLSDGFWNNDIYRLNTQIIQQAFRLFDDRKVRYLSDDQCVEAMTRSSKSVFFKVAPVDKNEFTTTANLGNVLPPKSTWMSPKSPSFLIMNKYQK